MTEYNSRLDFWIEELKEVSGRVPSEDIISLAYLTIKEMASFQFWPFSVDALPEGGLEISYGSGTRDVWLRYRNSGAHDAVLIDNYRPADCLSPIDICRVQMFLEGA